MNEVDKLKILLLDYDSFVNKNMLVEINLSCPNLEIEIPGYNKHFIERLLLVLVGYSLKNIKFGFKLPPYFERSIINDLADLFNRYQHILVYIVSANSIPSCVPITDNQFSLSKIYGGLSGKVNKYIALSNVLTFSKKIDKNITIIGCGGIETIEDIYDYLNNGASLVQLASCFYDETNNSLNIDKINTVIDKYINTKI
jgi:dihydroorotate dehydrogenase (fumarate)